MRVPPEIRDVTAREFIAALKRDDFELVKSKGKGSGAHRIYRRARDKRRVTVSYKSSGATFPLGTLKRMLVEAGWASLERDAVDESALRRVKLIK